MRIRARGKVAPEGQGVCRTRRPQAPHILASLATGVVARGALKAGRGSKTEGERGVHVMDLSHRSKRGPLAQAHLSFDRIYRHFCVHVARWVRAFGAHHADVDDLTQQVFIIVWRKLPGFDGQNLGGFLYRITQRTVRDHRRTVWCRHFLARREPLPDPDWVSAGGVEAVQRNERRCLLDAILGRMSEKRRATLILFEIEGYSGEEIARIQSVPLKTVWTRLHYARKDFVRMVSALPREADE